MYADRDIYSSREVYSTTPNTNKPPKMMKAKAAFHALDSPNGAVRHASFFESGFCALVITSDNVKSLRKSTRKNVVARFSGQILELGQLQGQYLLLQPEHLATIENQDDKIVRCDHLGAGPLRLRIAQKTRRRPTKPFFHVPKRMVTQHYDSSNEGPFDLAEEISVSASMAVLIHGRGLAHGNQQSSLCVHFIHESLDAPNKDNLAAVIKETFQDRDVYHTTRDNERFDLKATKD
ncbi:MAG: hypothetical protein Q9217_001010 [Psora testacea]